MVACQNCGKFNAYESHFCRFCGTRMMAQQPQAQDPDPYGHGAPRPYSWKTDEFQTSRPQRGTDQINRGQAADNTSPIYQPAPLAYSQPQNVFATFGCPQCGSRHMPRLEKRISTSGWITFAVLLVFFFPLFWIGLLIKEEVQICQICNTKINPNYR
jgi:predicted RNA-binding Zn-ribbon protein involved in translation (DUF1610 family)